MSRLKLSTAALGLSLALGGLIGPGAAQSLAQPRTSGPKPTAWFGVPTPGPVSDLDRPTYVSDANAYGMPPAHLAKAPPAILAGPKLMADMRTIVGFSRESRANGDLLWGRISGTPAEKKTVDWAVGRLKAAGLTDAHSEAFKMERPLWFPKSWEVRLVADPSFGAGTQDVVLRSAFPLPNSRTLAAALTAPLVFVGRGSPAELANIDLHGKIAVVNVVPDTSLYASREKGAAREAVKRGAVGVINAVESPGNLQFSDSRYGCDEAPCFTVGGDDGAFLESIIGRAAAAGKSASLKASLSLVSEMRTGLVAYNGVAAIPGKSSQIVIVNAHADAWFDGADDNADGLSVMLGLADYFARLGRKPERTLLFMVSAGHHTGNGAAAFIAANPDIIKRTVLVMNLEHLAQIEVTQAARLDPAVSPYAAGLWSATTAETPKLIGASNANPYVVELLGRASKRYGVITSYQPSTSAPGDLGSYIRAGKSAVQLISSEVYYHSSGDNPSTISEPGMERVAAFFADFIDAVAKAPADKLAPLKPAK